MSVDQNPATPANAAIPGSVPAVVTPTPVASPAPTGDQGNLQDGKVTIDLKEYRDLQRAKARTLSFEKRVALSNKQNQTINNPDGSPADVEIVERLNQETAARQEAERKVMQMQVINKVRGLLEQDEFKVLPQSTKELILRNPAMLSEAETLEEALIDIEEFVRDQVLSMDKVFTPTGTPTKNDVPPVVNSGSAAPVVPVGLEDVSNLSGTERSQAVIRNKIKQTRGII